MNSVPTEPLTLREAREHFRIPRTTLRDIIARHDLPTEVHNGPSLRGVREQVVLSPHTMARIADILSPDRNLAAVEMRTVEPGAIEFERDESDFEPDEEEPGEIEWPETAGASGSEEAEPAEAGDSRSLDLFAEVRLIAEVDRQARRIAELEAVVRQRAPASEPPRVVAVELRLDWPTVAGHLATAARSPAAVHAVRAGRIAIAATLWFLLPEALALAVAQWTPKRRTATVRRQSYPANRAKAVGALRRAA